MGSSSTAGDEDTFRRLNNISPSVIPTRCHKSQRGVWMLQWLSLVPYLCRDAVPVPQLEVSPRALQATPQLHLSQAEEPQPDSFYNTLFI